MWDFNEIPPDFLTHGIVCVFSSGEKGTLTHGSIVDGKFEGFIQSQAGTYYVEPAERYLSRRSVPYHSVIYHEDDIGECLFLGVSVCVCVRVYVRVRVPASASVCVSIKQITNHVFSKSGSDHNFHVAKAFFSPPHVTHTSPSLTAGKMRANLFSLNI